MRRTSLITLMLFLTPGTSVKLGHKAQQDGAGLTNPAVAVDTATEAVDEVDQYEHDHHDEFVADINEAEEEFHHDLQGQPGWNEQHETDWNNVEPSGDALAHFVEAELDEADQEMHDNKDALVGDVGQFEGDATAEAEHFEGGPAMAQIKKYRPMYNKLAQLMTKLRAKKGGPDEEWMDEENKQGEYEAVNMTEDFEKDIQGPEFKPEVATCEEELKDNTAPGAVGPMPPPEDVQRAMEDLGKDIEREVQSPEFQNALREFEREVQNALHDLQNEMVGLSDHLGVPVPDFGGPDCGQKPEECFIGWALQLLDGMHREGMLDNFEDEIQDVAGKGGNDIPDDEFDREFQEGEDEGKKFNDEANYGEMEQEGENEMQACDCNNKDEFCNHDFGPGHGFCEKCPPENYCNDWGLPEFGAQDCNKYCFGV